MNTSVFYCAVPVMITSWSTAIAAPSDTLQEIVVTASRTAQSINESMAAVTVITREDLAQVPTLTLPQLLKARTGLEIASNGGLGQATSVFLRGTEADHIVVLIDGIKIGSATLGTVPFHDIPLSQIERIEIVRGPRSSLYGSEAIGGVIQIFTRQAGAQPQTEASVGVGTNRTYQLTAGTSGRAEKTWYSLNADYLSSDGFNNCQGNLNAGCFTVEPDNDSYDNTSFGVRLGHQLTPQWTLTGQALRVDGSSQYDSPGNNNLDFMQQLWGVQTAYFANESWNMNLSLGESRDEEDNFGRSELPQETYQTKRTVLSWQNNFTIGLDQQLSIGYDYQQDKIDSSVNYTVTARDNHGYFAQYQTPILTMGLRQDENEQFGGHTTYNLAVGYPISTMTRLYLSYGTAFKAPTFNELYYPGFGGFPAFGNPQLQPEESQSWELGIKGTQAEYSWSWNAFRTNIDNLIGGYPAANINQATITGSEGNVQWQRGGWEFYAQVSWLKPEDKLTGHLLPRRAKTSLNLGLAETLGAARLEMNWFYQSHRYDDVANTQILDGYHLFNLNGEYRFGSHWKLVGRLENMLDEEYQTVKFYNMPGRSLLVSLHYQ